MSTLTILLIMTIYTMIPPMIYGSDIFRCADSGQCANGDISEAMVYCTAKDSCKNSTIITPRQPKTGKVICGGSTSCQSSGIKTTGRKEVYCSGFQSCSSPTSIITKALSCGGSQSCYFYQGEGSMTSTIKKTVCGGSYSCKGAGMMYSDGPIECNGLYSCADNTLTSGNSIYCKGLQSCDSATLTADDVVRCEGEGSCRYATISAHSVILYGASATYETTIKDATYVYAYGDKSFDAGCTIDSGSSQEMTVMMQSSDTRSTKAFVICRSGALCNLNCGSTGCQHIFYQCEDGATCNVSPAECATNPGANIKGTICPTMTNAALSLFDDLIDNEKKEVLPYNIKESYLLSSHIEEESSYLLSQTKEEKSAKRIQEESINSIKAYEEVSCGLERECEGHEYIGDGTQSTLYCDGSFSCEGATVRDKRTECNADNACNMIDILNANTMITCNAGFSCMDAKNLDSSTKIDCRGVYSCARSAIHSDIEVGCHGDASCISAQITVSAGFRTTCYGEDSCKDATIINDGYNIGSVVCYGKSSCERATITTSYEGVANLEFYAIQCLATGSCKDAIIESVGMYSKVKIGGFLSASGATINMHGEQVIVTGYRGLQRGTIDSTDSEQLTIQTQGKEVFFKGTLICRSGSECNLKCAGSSCVGVDYLCEHGAICNIQPTQCSTGLKRYMGTVCPDLQHVDTNYDLTNILRMKKLEEQDIIDANLLFEGGDVGVIQEGVSSFNMIAIIGILSLIGFIVIYLWWKVRTNEQYKILN